jgi:DNA replication regulator DPB11
VGLKIAVSGIDQLERRREIIRHINLEGGVYSKELDRSCTHLISAHGTREKVKMSEKVKWAVKEMGDREAQKRRGARLEGEPLRIVYEEWVWDCVGLRGRVKEESYDARVPRRAGRVSYESVMDGTAFLPPEKEAEGGKNVDEEENAPVKNVRKRKHETMENLVGELLGEAKAEPKEQEEPKDEVQDLAEDNKSEVKPKVEQPAEAMPARDSAFEVKQSVLHASRSTAFSIDSPPSVVTAGPSRLSPPARGTPPDRPAPTLFAGLRMSHAVSEGYEVLEIALKEHGATLVREQDRLLGSDVDYLVVRL